MSTQFIIDNATSLKIELLSITESARFPSGAVRGAIPTKNKGTINAGAGDFTCYKIIVGAPQGLKYSENRDLMEDLYFNEQTTTANVSLSNNPGMSYITDDPAGGLLGDAFSNASNQFNDGQVLAVSTGSTGIDRTGNFLNTDYANMPYINFVNKSGVVPATITAQSGNIAMKAGKWLQIDQNYTSGTVTEGMSKPFRLISDVLFGSSTSGQPFTSTALPGKRTLPNDTTRKLCLVDRMPVVNSTDIYVKLKADGDVRFKLKPLQIPNYTITPGDNIQFDGDFVYIEETVKNT